MGALCEPWRRTCRSGSFASVASLPFGSAARPPRNASAMSMQKRALAAEGSSRMRSRWPMSLRASRTSSSSRSAGRAGGEGVSRRSQDMSCMYAFSCGHVREGVRV
jgi:hypothetical protein